MYPVFIQEDCQNPLFRQPSLPKLTQLTLVPAHEQWMCIGGAITNMLNAAHAMGFGAKILSGNITHSALIVQTSCLPGETLAG